MVRSSMAVVVLVVTALVVTVPQVVGAVELTIGGSNKEIFKSSMKAIGKGLEAGDFSTMLRSARTKEGLLSLQRLFYTSALGKPLALKCRYGAAPKRKRTLDLNHAVEVRLDVPLNLHLKDAAVSLSVDASTNHRETANVLFSFSF